MADLGRNPDRLIVGLTGGIATGKSTVGETLEQLGAQRINVDDINHEVMQPGGRAYREIAKNWPQYVGEDEKIVKKALRDHIFKEGNERERKLLEAITRPAIKTEVGLQLENPTGYYTVYESALLFETGAYKNMNSVIVVDAPQDAQVERAYERDGQESRVEEIIALQMTREERLERADYVIKNEGTEKELIVATYALHFSGLLPIALAKSAPRRV